MVLSEIWGILVSNLPLSSSHPGDYDDQQSHTLTFWAPVCLNLSVDSLRKKKPFRLVYTAKWWHISSYIDALRWAPSLHPERSRKHNKRKLRTALTHWFLTFPPSPSHGDIEPHSNPKMSIITVTHTAVHVCSQLGWFTFAIWWKSVTARDLFFLPAAHSNDAVETAQKVVLICLS